MTSFLLLKYAGWRRNLSQIFRGSARPYDLRHACASTWLNAGVAPTRVAQWLGHSVEVLLRVYAKCIDGHEDADRRLIEKFINPDEDA
jgi:integrase